MLLLSIWKMELVREMVDTGHAEEDKAGLGESASVCSALREAEV